MGKNDTLRLCEDLVRSVWHISSSTTVLIPKPRTTNFCVSFFFVSKWLTIFSSKNSYFYKIQRDIKQKQRTIVSLPRYLLLTFLKIKVMLYTVQMYMLYIHYKIHMGQKYTKWKSPPKKNQR